MTSVSTILESVGINYSDLAAQVRDSRRAAEAGTPAALEHDRLACAVEQLAHRLVTIAGDVEDGFDDYYVGGTCMMVFDAATGEDEKDPVETLRSHLGLDGSQPLLPAASVFGHPELRLVSHVVPDNATGRFTISSYLVDVHTGEVTPAPGGPQTTAEAAAALRA